MGGKGGRALDWREGREGRTVPHYQGKRRPHKANARAVRCSWCCRMRPSHSAVSLQTTRFGSTTTRGSDIHKRKNSGVSTIRSSESHVACKNRPPLCAVKPVSLRCTVVSVYARLSDPAAMIKNTRRSMAPAMVQINTNGMWKRSNSQERRNSPRPAWLAAPHPV